MQVEHRLNLEV